MKKGIFTEEVRAELQERLDQFAEEKGIEYYHAQMIGGYDVNENFVYLEGASTSNITEEGLLTHCENESSEMVIRDREARSYKEGYGLGTLVGVAAASLVTGWITRGWVEKAKREKMHKVITKKILEIDVEKQSKEEIFENIQACKVYIIDNVIKNMKDIKPKEREQWYELLRRVIELQDETLTD